MGGTRQRPRPPSGGALIDATQPARYHFSDGNPGPDLVPAADLAEAARSVLLREGSLLSRYPSPLGPERLRDVIVAKMRATRGISWVSRDDVLATNGSLHAIALVAQTLLRPGDVVVSDRFMYRDAVRVFHGLGAEILTVETDDEGTRVDDLEAKLHSSAARGKLPKFIYSVPGPQNPTAAVMPLERRRSLLALAKEFEVVLVEDDCYVDQALDAESMPPAMASLEGGDSGVIYIATFSKIVGPGIRVGWIAAEPELLRPLTANKQDGGNSYLSGLIVAEYIGRHLESRIAWLNERLRARRDTMAAALAQHFGAVARFRPPRAGMSIWVEFDEGFDLPGLEPAADEQGIRYLSGPIFSPAGEGARYARFNFSYPTETEIVEGMERLASVFRQRGLPV